MNEISCDKKEKIEKINSQILGDFKLMSISSHTVQKNYVNMHLLEISIESRFSSGNIIGGSPIYISTIHNYCV
jgi:hypothetical protein